MMEPACRVVVMSLHPRTTDKDLQGFMSRAGSVNSCEIVRDSEGRSKCFGYVTYSSPEEAQRAIIDLDDIYLDDRVVHVAPAVEQIPGRTRESKDEESESESSEKKKHRRRHKHHRHHHHHHRHKKKRDKDKDEEPSESSEKKRKSKKHRHHHHRHHKHSHRNRRKSDADKSSAT